MRKASAIAMVALLAGGLINPSHEALARGGGIGGGSHGVGFGGGFHGGGFRGGGFGGLRGGAFRRTGLQNFAAGRFQGGRFDRRFRRFDRDFGFYDGFGGLYGYACDPYYGHLYCDYYNKCRFHYLAIAAGPLLPAIAILTRQCTSPIRPTFLGNRRAHWDRAFFLHVACHAQARGGLDPTIRAPLGCTPNPND